MNAAGFNPLFVNRRGMLKTWAWKSRSSLFGARVDNRQHYGQLLLGSVFSTASSLDGILIGDLELLS